MESTEFKSNAPIYRQIVDAACQKLLTGEWADGTRIPSVRELSVELGVNSRTVLKAMEYLQTKGVIFPKRGMGYYAAEDARSQVYQMRREEFLEETLPDLCRKMQELSITPDELRDHLRKYM